MNADEPEPAQALGADLGPPEGDALKSMRDELSEAGLVHDQAPAGRVGDEVASQQLAHLRPSGQLVRELEKRRQGISARPLAW